MALHMRFESVLVDGATLTVQAHQCLTTKQYVVQCWVDSAQVKTVADIPKHRKQRWLAQYDNPHDAMQRFTLGVTDELRRKGMGQTDWERQLVAADAKALPTHSEGLKP